ncbi:MAG: TIGR01777 family oxidoreductase [Anaerolineae bacterium]
MITEDHPPGDDFLSRVCIEWEQVTEPVEEIGVRHVILRTGIVLSMEEGALPRMVLPFRFFAGGPLGSGEQWYSWIHLEDEARAIHWLLENEEASGVYNLSAPNPIRQKDLAKIIGKEMGRPWFVPAPAFALKTALGEEATVELDGQRAVPARLEDEGFTFEYTQAEEAIADLL